MTLSRTPHQFCMRLKTILRRPQGDKKKKTDRSSRGRRTIYSTTKIFPEEGIAELLFDSCVDCKKMSAIPQGVFAARKVRENEEQYLLISNMSSAKDGGNENKGNYHSYSNNKPINQCTELTPLKYNSKLMNSIWGLYNRYSVHNFKKNTDSKDGGLVAGWRASLAPLAPQNPATATSDKPRVLLP